MQKKISFLTKIFIVSISGVIFTWLFSSFLHYVDCYSNFLLWMVYLMVYAFLLSSLISFVSLLFFLGKRYFCR